MSKKRLKLKYSIESIKDSRDVVGMDSNGRLTKLQNFLNKYWYWLSKKLYQVRTKRNWLSISEILSDEIRREIDNEILKQINKYAESCDRQ